MDWPGRTLPSATSLAYVVGKKPGNRKNHAAVSRDVMDVDEVVSY